MLLFRRLADIRYPRRKSCAGARGQEGARFQCDRLPCRLFYATGPNDARFLRWRDALSRPERIQAVLFDMDGTTVDSEHIKNEQLARLLRSHGADVDAAGLAHVSGMDLQGLLGAIQAILDRSHAAARAADVLGSSPYGREAPYLDIRCKPIEGAVEFIEALRAQGIASALVSNTPSYAVAIALDRLRMMGLFDVIIGGDMLEHHKPDPEGYVLAMRLLDVPPHACIVIEDSAPGIAAGLAAGAYVCALDDGSGSLDLSAAHERFSSYADLVLW